jgi:hypothetical protein
MRVRGGWIALGEIAEVVAVRADEPGGLEVEDRAPEGRGSSVPRQAGFVRWWLVDEVAADAFGEPIGAGGFAWAYGCVNDRVDEARVEHSNPV